MKTFVFYWNDGSKNYFTGESAFDYFKKMGYGPKEVKGLFTWEETDDLGSYQWNRIGKEWVKR